MKKRTQAESNPFPHTDSNKRYYTYDYYLKTTYGGKCAKITLDAGFSCPNIDGACPTGGCIYCSSRGSGDFAASPLLSLREQYESQVAKMTKKWDTPRFIPYLQAHTNTYAPVDRLRAVYREAMALPGAVALHVATRADCLGDDVIALLCEVAEVLPLTVELGLQSVFDKTAERIDRGHSYADFLDGYCRLRAASDAIRIGVHLINGLPGEGEEEMLTSAAAVGALYPDEIKLHLLHVLKNTPLASMYERGEYTPLSKEAYVSIVTRQLALLPKSIVIGRLTGDGAESDLLAPRWSLKKLCVINDIDKELFRTDTYQGKFVENAQKHIKNISV